MLFFFLATLINKVAVDGRDETEARSEGLNGGQDFLGAGRRAVEGDQLRALQARCACSSQPFARSSTQ